MERLPDWEDRLHALIVEKHDEPFRWGKHDCALFGAAVVAAITGEDHGAPFANRYDDAEGAARALRKYGKGTITKTFDAHLDRRAVALLRRGDLAMQGEGMQSSIGVVIGNDALFVGDMGLERRDRSTWARGWAVG